jgi:hypothetical protein
LTFLLKSRLEPNHVGWCTVSIPSYEYGPIFDVRDRSIPNGLVAPQDRYARSIAFWLLDIVGRSYSTRLISS